MKWEMDVEDIEAVLEKIWDLHDKLSDAIHSASRTHFLNSVNSLRKSGDLFVLDGEDKKSKPPFAGSGDGRRTGFVFVKGFRVEAEDDSAVQEAKSLNAIRTALENLEDQLEFFHTAQIQQRAERDAAIGHLEQCRLVLAMRLAEHQGKKYEVIEEARAFVGDVRDAGHFGSHENLHGSAACPAGENFVSHEGKRSNVLVKFLVSSFNFAKKSLKLDEMGGLLGNAALVAVSMLALLHLNQVAAKERYILDHPSRQEEIFHKQNVTKVYQPGSSSSGGRLAHLDVLLARG
ncbi:hypothetical protein RJ639_036128 [Escallonia herrerae]|uniref:Plastid division protein PDV1 n=1 Tax=Escallonia herrerae TaxID=1293975 RepID=A0AA89BDI9_9ASTE|nr:hypothetical protein RJ639_036128 [Escallonia herrerae]